MNPHCYFSICASLKPGASYSSGKATETHSQPPLIMFSIKCNAI